MSRPLLSVRHVETRDLLPAKLTRGRIYFIEDEQVLVINHGNVTAEYGGRPGPQGEPGEPLPQLQEQLNDLAQSSMATQNVVWKEIEQHRKDTAGTRELISNIREDMLNRLNASNQMILVRISGLNDSMIERTDNITASLTKTNQAVQFYRTQGEDARAQLQEQNNYNADAVLTLTALLHQKFTEYDKILGTIIKAITNLYPEHYQESIPKPIEGGDDYADPLDNETIETDAGKWVIQQTILEDGTMLLELDAQELLIDTLTEGSTFEHEGETYTVSSYEKSEDGTITMTLTK